ncbi:restriction endonuclease subunit S [Apilactobacillus kunkeei]|uniref:restriction endonuclease subunit S n=1 Tax=Apilactobacillus kunkeei TaxID=148814 RepID=UPI0006C3B04A|nr:restriction endonuclease subunit S [Apilactobacillus kunkeei]KOY71591.1 Type I restriction-modification HsdS subunit [Apilactobacillus kunkeei]
MAKINVPRLRFREFNESWQSNNLGDKLKVTMGQSPHSKNYTNDCNQNILVQGNADILDGKINPRIYTSEVTKVSKKNEIIMTVRAPVGELAVNYFSSVVIGRGVASLAGNSFDYFLLERSKMIGIWNRLSSGSTFDAVNSSDIKSLKINYPSLNEQKIIGSFFVKIDKIIELKKKKLELLKKLKQGYIKKMLTENEELIPKLRFSRFNGTWKKLNIGEVINYEQPTKYIVKSTKYSDEFSTPVLTAGKTFLLGYTNEESVKVASETNPVIIFDDFTTSSHYVNFPFKVKSSAMKILTAANNNDTYFMYCLLKSINYVPADHSRQWISNFSKMSLMIPDYYEQNKISLFIKKIDKMINVQCKEIKALQQEKKAYLQKMFI